jgi:hypothetical protein
VLARKSWRRFDSQTTRHARDLTAVKAGNITAISKATTEIATSNSTKLKAFLLLADI